MLEVRVLGANEEHHLFAAKHAKCMQLHQIGEGGKIVKLQPDGNEIDRRIGEFAKETKRCPRSKGWAISSSGGTSLDKICVLRLQSFLVIRGGDR